MLAFADTQFKGTWLAEMKTGKAFGLSDVSLDVVVVSWYIWIQVKLELCHSSRLIEDVN